MVTGTVIASIKRVILVTYIQSLSQTAQDGGVSKEDCPPAQLNEVIEAGLHIDFAKILTDSLSCFCPFAFSL